MNANEIYSVLKTGTSSQIKSLIENLPPSNFKESALALSDPSHPSSVVLGLTSLVLELCEGKNPEQGASLAEATYRRAFELYHQEPNHGGLLPTTLSNIASQHLKALNLMGRSDEVLAIADSYLQFFEQQAEMENYPSLMLAKASALFNLNRIDESRESLHDIDFTKNPGAMIGRDLLLKQIDGLSVEATGFEQLGQTVDLRQSMIDALEQVDASVFGSNQDVFEQLKHTLVDKNNASLDPNDIDQFQQLRKILDSGESLLTQGGGSKNEVTMRKKCRDATSIFHPGALEKPSEATIKNSLKQLNEVYHWASIQNSKELLNDAIWGLYLCRSRLGRSSEAADALIELRTQLEVQRAGIVDPIRRGGAFSTYSQLFNVSCERLSESGRYVELLEAIEASKGRAIADILTRKLNRPVPDADIYGAVSKLPALTQQHRFHYLSFYLDRFEGTALVYSVMVCKDGKTYSKQPVKLPEENLDGALKSLNPDDWGKPWYQEITKPKSAAALAPIVDLIIDLKHRGVIEEGDHICYSADEQLNNIPMHYLDTPEGLLIDHFSFSRIHNVAQLDYLLERNSQKPKQAELFVVPTQQDTTEKFWNEFERNINRPATVLAEFCDIKVFKDQQVNLKALKGYQLTDSILHFSTHGVSDIGNMSPFTSWGLVISDGQQLPDKDRIAKEELDSVLTPSKLLDSDLDLSGSHVSLMACVSGLSREALGGDAIGLDWAMVNAGASSILSSHWHVSAKFAADFFEQFYRFWLGDNQSKAQAFRNTILAMNPNTDALRKYQCSAFSLSGDWR